MGLARQSSFGGLRQPAGAASLGTLAEINAGVNPGDQKFIRTPLVILILFVGGLGFMARALRPYLGQNTE
jgi:hypothetical protein